MHGVRPRAEAPQRRLLHPSARRSRTRCSTPCRRRSTIAEQCGVHVEIVHFKCSGTDNWGKAATALEMIADAKARGLDVDCDSYPYAAGSNPLKNLLPQWVQSGGVPAMLERLEARRDPRAHPRRHRARRPEQLGPHPVVGLRADLDLAAPAAVRRPHHPRARDRARPGPGRHAVRLSRRRPGRDARAGHLDLGGRHRAHRRLAAGAGRLRRQLRRALWHRRQGHAASALLRHLPAHHPPLRRASAARCRWSWRSTR